MQRNCAIREGRVRSESRPRSDRLRQADREAYKHNLNTRCVNALKQFHGTATRYDKTTRAFLSMLCIGAAKLWIKAVNTA